MLIWHIWTEHGKFTMWSILWGTHDVSWKLLLRIFFTFFSPADNFHVMDRSSWWVDGDEGQDENHRRIRYHPQTRLLTEVVEVCKLGKNSDLEEAWKHYFLRCILTSRCLFRTSCNAFRSILPDFASAMSLLTGVAVRILVILSSCHLPCCSILQNMHFGRWH